METNKHGGRRINSGRPKGRTKGLISFSVKKSFVELIKSNSFLRERIVISINIECNKFLEND